MAGVAICVCGVFYACILGGSPLNSATLYSGSPGLPRRHPLFHAFGAAHAVSGTPTSDRYSGTDRQGDGKGRLFDRPLFVEGLLPGEQALVELTEVKPNYLHGKLVELTQPSADRVADFAPTPNGWLPGAPAGLSGPACPQAEPGAERTGAGRAG